MTLKPNDIGNKAIVFMNTDPEESAGMAILLQESDFSACCVGSPSELKKKLKEASFLAVIIDLDSMAVDNRGIKELALQFPTIPLLCISRKRFHPELQNSIRDHVYACLTKPIDPAELSYWLQCIRKDDLNLTVG
jgi:DNA-binding NtrC family response regulator